MRACFALYNRYLKTPLGSLVPSITEVISRSPLLSTAALKIAMKTYLGLSVIRRNIALVAGLVAAAVFPGPVTLALPGRKEEKF
jgi:hypothetical protein